MQIEFFLLVISTLFFASILAGKAGSRYGVPALLLFLGVGMLFGSDGIGIHFDNIKLAQLSMFLTLGLLVNPSELKDVLVPGLVISFVMYKIKSLKMPLDTGRFSSQAA